MGWYNDFNLLNDGGQQEKWQHARFRINARVAIRLSDGDIVWAQGVDLSTGGIYIKCGSPAVVDKEFEILFDLPLKKDFKRVFVRARVVRWNIIANRDVFGIAFSFSEFGKDTKKVLEEYIRLRQQMSSGH